MGFCGYFSKDKINSADTVTKMAKKLTDKNNEDRTIYWSENFVLGGSCASEVTKYESNKYLIAFYGELYNKQEIAKYINENDTLSDALIVLFAYLKLNSKCLDILNGVYSFVIYDKTNNDLFLARDRLGIKPLYYTHNDNFIFSTEIKSMLGSNNINATIGPDEICELFGLGPAHTLGKTFFKDIFEILPGHFGVYKNGKFNEYKYWDLETKEINDDINCQIQNVKTLVENSLNRQCKINNNDKICSMLSGGLDSSILAYLASKQIKELNTYSIDFESNDKNFIGNDYQPTRDSDFVKIMQDFLNTNHTNLYFNTEEILASLKEAIVAKDMPGMADIDSSMLVFLKKIKQEGYNISISGECSDEIFGGYPWYYKNHLINSITFPWSRSVETRKNIINSNIVSKEYLENYIKNSYNNSLKEIVYNSQDANENTFRKTCYLTIKWFMNTLIERTERMSLVSGVNVRTPFADYKIFEYVYNLSYKNKLGLINNNDTPIEKYLLRKAFENELPKEVVYRKKSPFPKTYDPNYTLELENIIKNIINKSNSPILELIDVKYLYEILETKGNNLKENWFGQLMTYPQTLAYLIQINMWLEEYNVKIVYPN